MFNDERNNRTYICGVVEKRTVTKHYTSEEEETVLHMYIVMYLKSITLYH
jgi:hypothetical protein